MKIFIFIFLFLIHKTVANTGKEVSYESLFNIKEEKSETTQIYTYVSKYTDTSKLKETILNLFPQTLISVQNNSQKISFKTSLNTYSKIKKILTTYDKEVDLIKLDIKVIEISSDHSNNFGFVLPIVQTGIKSNYNTETKKITPIPNLDVHIQTLINSGKAKLKANPTLISLNNEISKIRVGDSIPYTTTETINNTTREQLSYIDTGIDFEIKSKRISEEKIITTIKGKINAIKLFKQFKSGSYPVLTSRETNAVIQLKKNEPLIFAGLLNEETKTSTSKFPILGDIPFIGNFFKSTLAETIKTDVVFILTMK